MHPLDGIAKRCTDLLKVYDKVYNITSDTFGNGCCAVNFMYAMTKMCFKQETRKKIAVIEESYKRKYRVLQKAMQNCV